MEARRRDIRGFAGRTGPELGTRESRRLTARYQLTEEEVLRPRPPDERVPRRLAHGEPPRARSAVDMEIHRRSRRLRNPVGGPA
jgi:hypothetical protein